MNGEDTSTSLVRAADGAVYAANGFYELLDYDGAPDILADAGVANGLVAVGSTGAIVLTGTIFGPVALRVEIHAAAPPIDVAGWEKVVEVEQYTPSGTVSVNAPTDGAVEDLPALETTADSWYRIRVHARGIEEARNYATTVPRPIEHHLVQLWPEAPQTDDIKFPNPALREYRHLHPTSPPSMPL
ncbi:hypothetical protein [Couchioplanes azureus]|uniref:hypothetical protein n=1 Tax=Couchioplanes caeruleus TaxID=56438 RepID=UPI00166FB5A0|nr:hypothetical protein [Couchioplanes caeruleus]GGQ67154.1 hypothetical protein GCM10010166_41240 [Couchioplanes caeruleus subsp. azureus]